MGTTWPSLRLRTQVGIISDMNISKHALNRLVECIVLGSFLFFYSNSF